MIIDCDSHFMPRDAFDHVGDAFMSQRPRLQFDQKGLLVGISFPGQPPVVPGSTPHSAPPAPGCGFDLEGNTEFEPRLEYYSQMGIQRHFILPQFTGWWSYLVEPDLASALARSWNLSMLRLMAAYPGQVYGVALIALQDVSRANEELEWAKTHGFPAAVLDYTFPVWEHPYGTTLASHHEVWPFFQKAEELEMPLFLHAVQHGHRIANLLRFQIDGLDLFAPRDAQMNLVALITSGLLDRYPRLQFIHAEIGTQHIKPLAERLDAAFHARANGKRLRVLSPDGPQIVPPGVADEKNERLPSYYFKHNFYWTIETEEPELPEAVAFLGADRFLFATDYPHDDPGGSMKLQDVELLAANPLIAEADKELIRASNALQLFRLS
jgi:predicted TIM-barrel fold metal-dependent hydrolase